MADTGPRREEVAGAMVQSGTVGRMSMSPSPFYRRNNVSRGNALAVPKDCPGVALHCARKTMPTCYQSRFRSTLRVSFQGGEGWRYEIPDELASVFLQSSDWQLNGGLSIDAERERKKRK